MLIIFNSLQMTSAQFISNGSNTQVATCSTGNGFDAWMGVQIGIFACVMTAGAVVAFRTRTVPSAFNESSHILFSLQILLFMLLILAPLDWALINNSPEASIVIQAGGQLVLSLFLLVSNFGPKLYYLLTGRGDDKSMIFNTTSQKHSSNSHSSSQSTATDKNSSTHASSKASNASGKRTSDNSNANGEENEVEMNGLNGRSSNQV